MLRDLFNACIPLMVRVAAAGKAVRSRFVLAPPSGNASLERVPASRLVNVEDGPVVRLPGGSVLKQGIRVDVVISVRVENVFPSRAGLVFAARNEAPATLSRQQALDALPGGFLVAIELPSSRVWEGIDMRFRRPQVFENILLWARPCRDNDQSQRDRQPSCHSA